MRAFSFQDAPSSAIGQESVMGNRGEAGLATAVRMRFVNDVELLEGSLLFVRCQAALELLELPL
jgi:hypothetical protein